MELGTFLVMLLSFTGAAVTVIATIVWAIGRVKRLSAGSTPAQLTPEELEDILARLVELEHRDVRVEEIEERLDFVERVLGRSREPKALPDPSEKV